MPCSDSSSRMNIRLDAQGRFVKFDFTKITCGGTIAGCGALSGFCAGRSLEEILDLDFRMLVSALDLNADEEGQFLLYIELDALKCAVVRFLGIEHPGVDTDRCQVISVEEGEGFTDIALLVLPPKELPEILPCDL